MADTNDRLVVFDIMRLSVCSRCGDELGKGSLIKLENDEAVCAECAELDHLWFLPSGNTALTRRATKHSRITAVVVRCSRARKRYERRGILAEREAIEQAEAECLQDEDLRQRRREREAMRRIRIDQEYLKVFAARIRELWPGCPEEEAQKIAEHACLKHSGRVGRSAAAKELDATAVDLAVRAHIRHRHTRYDELMSADWDRQSAREEVRGEMWEVEETWRPTA